jgi:hypothetical protein
LPAQPRKRKRRRRVAASEMLGPLDGERAMNAERCASMADGRVDGSNSNEPAAMTPVIEHAHDDAEVTDAVGDEGLAAGAAAFLFSNQKPMSRYEQRPTPSQPTNSSGRLLASTRMSIDAVNRFRYAKKRPAERVHGEGHVHGQLAATRELQREPLVEVQRDARVLDPLALQPQQVDEVVERQDERQPHQARGR